jgi:hypothetical protein
MGRKHHVQDIELAIPRSLGVNRHFALVRIRSRNKQGQAGFRAIDQELAQLIHQQSCVGDNCTVRGTGELAIHPPGLFVFIWPVIWGFSAATCSRLCGGARAA